MAEPQRDPRGPSEGLAERDEAFAADVYAPPEPVPATERFKSRVSLTPAEIVDAFANDQRILWCPNADPPAFSAPGARPYQAWPAGHGAIFLRCTVPAMVHEASPYVLIQYAEAPEGGTNVTAKFLKRPANMTISQSTIVLGTIGLLGMAALLTVAVVVAGTYQFFTIGGCIVAAVVLAQYSRNRPSEQSMVRFGHHLRAILGEKFVPHALGGADQGAPFRLPEGKR